MNNSFMGENCEFSAERKLMTNIYYLDQLKDKITFSKNTNVCITSSGIQTYLLRHYYILNLLMLNKAVTADYLLDFYQYFGNDPSIRSKEDLRHQFFEMMKLLEKNTWAWNGRKFTGIIKRNEGAFFNSEAVYSITPIGLEYLKSINDSLQFEINITKLTNEEYKILSRHKNSRKATNNHSLFVMNMVSGVLSCLLVPRLSDFAIEAGRGCNYQIQRGKRPDSFKIPDISFMYYTGNIFDTYVGLEADLLTEAGSAFTHKLLDDLTNSYKQTRQYAQFPGTTIYVLGTNPKAVRKSSFNEHYQEGNIISDELKKGIEWCLLVAQLNGAQLREEFALNGIINRLKQINMDTQSESSFYDPEEMDKTYVKILNSIKKFESINGTLSLERYRRICGNTKKKKGKNTDEILSGYVKFSNRRRTAFRNLTETEGVDKMFKIGHSIVMASYWELDKVIPSVLPYVGGIDNVRAVLKAVGLPESWKRFWPSLPLYKAPDEFCINMRNCFLSDGVFVSIEDTTYDLSALSRIREYVSNPTGLIRNAILCIIVNDDLTLANGMSLEDTNYWKGKFLDAQDTFKECIVKEFGKRGKIPYRYRIAADFCFIRRSEYLTADSEKIHPFLMFDRDVFYERTAVGMNEDTRRVKHNDGLRLIALPILKPEEFKAYDYSFIY